jgi:N-acetylneuraminic acid mutarotase
MGLLWGAAVVHGSTAYFSSDHNVYSYTVPGNKWTKLPECKYRFSALAVVNDTLTTIGGLDRQKRATDTFVSLSGSSWEEVLPPMPTERVHPAAATTPTHLVVAGGEIFRGFKTTVEVLNTETLQWSTASSLPETVGFPQITTCGGYLYLSDAENNNAYSCSVEDLKSTNSSDGGSVWTKLASIPTPRGSSLATLRGRVLAIGADNGWGSNPTGAIHCYDMTTDSWSVVSEMPTPRSQVLTAVLPGNQLVVVGGRLQGGFTVSTEIGSCSPSP